MGSVHIVAALLLLITVSAAFVPQPTDPALVAACESTNGTISESYYTPDCGPGCSAMPETISDCVCPDGTAYMDIKRAANFSGCTGAEPECFSDSDCMRTSQGNACMGGACAYVSQPPWEGSYCWPFPAFALIALCACMRR